MPKLDSRAEEVLVLLEDLMAKTRLSKYWEDIEVTEVDDLKLVSDESTPSSKDQDDQAGEWKIAVVDEEVTKKNMKKLGRLQKKTKKSGRLQKKKEEVQVAQLVSSRGSFPGQVEVTAELKTESWLDTSHQVQEELAEATGNLRVEQRVCNRSPWYNSLHC